MPSKAVYKVYFEPVGVEMEVEEDETILNAAFRQGVSLMHGCKEGQCASCKAILNEGDIDLLKYSTFALSDPERETDHILLCRTVAYSDLNIELLNYDEELLSRSIPVKDYPAKVCGVESLTHDIFRLEVELETETTLKFWAGQYVDITLPMQGITRAFSMANAPSEGRRLSFIIKKYPNGAFSSLLDDGGLKAGDGLSLKGPYGTCFRREERSGPMILVGGGSGMSPLWSILHDLLESGEQRTVYFFYGARAQRDLFYLDALAKIAQDYPGFHFIPALSEPAPDDNWDGETGFIHEVLARYLREQAEGLNGDNQPDAYICGPSPMIDAVLPVLQMNNIEPEHIYFDRFTPSLNAN